MRRKNEKKSLALLAMTVCISLGLLVGGAFAKTELTLWGHSGPPHMKAHELLILEFEEQNPDIKIIYQTFPGHDFHAKLAVATATGTGPDIANAWGERIPGYIDAKALDPVPSWVMTMEEFEQTYYAPPRGAITSGGEFYGMPVEFNIGGGLLVNWDMFDEEGIPHRAPENWDELIEWAKKLTRYDDKGNVTRLGFAYTYVDELTFMPTKIIRQLGGDIRAEDGLHFDVDNPIAYEAMAFVADLTRKHKVNSIDISYQGTGAMPFQLFMKEQAAIAIGGSFVARHIETNVPELNFGYVVDPNFGELPYFYAETGWTMIVLGHTPHKTESWKLVEFYAKKENARKANLTMGNVPARKDLTNDPVLLKDFPYFNVPWSILPYGKWIGYLGDRNRVFVDGFYNHIMEVIRGEKTVKEASRDLNSFLNGVIDEYY